MIRSHSKGHVRQGIHEAHGIEVRIETSEASFQDLLIPSPRKGPGFSMGSFGSTRAAKY